MSFFRQIFTVFPHFGKTGIFPDMRFSLNCGHYQPLTACAKPEKSNDVHSRKITKRFFGPESDPIFGADFKGEGVEISKIWLVPFRKSNSRTFQKSKRILICFNRSRDIHDRKKVLFHRFYPFSGPQLWNRFFFGHAVFGKMKPLLASNYTQESQEK